MEHIAIHIDINEIDFEVIVLFIPVKVIITCFCHRKSMKVMPVHVKVINRFITFLSQEIDEGHACYSHKYIKNKLVKELKDEQFLKLLSAEEDGLLTIKIFMDASEEGTHIVFFTFIKFYTYYFHISFKH